MPVRNALEALTMRPTDLLRSPWPWRSLAYLTGGAVLGFATILTIAGLLTVGLVLTVVVVGIAGYLATVLSGVAVARLERWRLRLVDDDPLPDPHGRPPRPGLYAWVLFRLREQSTWRELGYTMLSALVLCWGDALVVAGAAVVPLYLISAPLYVRDSPLTVTVPLAFVGVLLAVIMAYPVTAWAGARAAMARAILAPRLDDTGTKLVEVTRSRARLVDAFELERRRIERDLHDGAQQRLVALRIELELAEELVRKDPARGADRLHELERTVDEALEEVRSLAHGVYPPVLADQGLAEALRAAAQKSPVHVHIAAEAVRRYTPEIESAVYFCILEALQNVLKHAEGARNVSVSLDGRGRAELRFVVRDDGAGVAGDIVAGTGITNMNDRIAAAGGVMDVTTTVHVGTTVSGYVPTPTH